MPVPEIYPVKRPQNKKQLPDGGKLLPSGSCVHLLLRQIPSPHIEDREDQIEYIREHKSHRDRGYGDICQNADTVDNADDQDGFFRAVHHAHNPGCKLDHCQE